MIRRYKISLVALCLCTAGAVFAWRGRSAEQEPARPHRGTQQVVARDAKQRDESGARGFELLSANWGPIVEPQDPLERPDPRRRGTAAQIRRAEFAERAAERWQGTEIFVGTGSFAERGREEHR